MGVFVCLAQLGHCALGIQHGLFDCLGRLGSQPCTLPKAPLGLWGNENNFRFSRARPERTQQRQQRVILSPRCLLPPPCLLHEITNHAGRRWRASHGCGPRCPAGHRGGRCHRGCAGRRSHLSRLAPFVLLAAPLPFPLLDLLLAASRRSCSSSRTAAPPPQPRSRAGTLTCTSSPLRFASGEQAVGVGGAAPRADRRR